MGEIERSSIKINMSWLFDKIIKYRDFERE